MVLPMHTLAKAVAYGDLTVADWGRLLRDDTRRVGIAAAARTALREAALEVRQAPLRLQGADGEALRLSPWPPPARVARFVHAAWKRQQWRELRRRRKDFADVPMPDAEAVAAEVARERPVDQAAALRAVLAGSAIPQTVAAKWTGTELCPYCRAGPETLYHRLWECPAWEAQREGPSRDRARRVPEAMRRSLVLPRNEEEEAARRLAEGAAPVGASTEPVGTVYTDGSAMEPRDRLLRRAAWSAAWKRDGSWRVVTGGVLGVQTSARAELTALEWVARCQRAGAAVAEVATDCQYVADGAAAAMAGSADDLCLSADGDLWGALRGVDMSAGCRPTSRATRRWPGEWRRPTGLATRWPARRPARRRRRSGSRRTGGGGARRRSRRCGRRTTPWGPCRRRRWRRAS